MTLYTVNMKRKAKRLQVGLPNRFIFIGCILLLQLTNNLFSQSFEHTISGYVYDGNRSPIAYANASTSTAADVKESRPGQRGQNGTSGTTRPGISWGTSDRSIGRKASRKYGTIIYWRKTNGKNGYPRRAKNTGGIVFTKERPRKNNREPSADPQKYRGVCPLGAKTNLKGSDWLCYASPWSINEDEENLKLHF